MYLVFNGANGPFKDARVRQAVAFAIKREEVAKAAFYGHATVLGGMPIPAACCSKWRRMPAVER